MTKTILAAAAGFACVMLAAAIQTNQPPVTESDVVAMQSQTSIVPNRAQAYALASGSIEG